MEDGLKIGQNLIATPVSAGEKSRIRDANFFYQNLEGKKEFVVTMVSHRTNKRVRVNVPRPIRDKMDNPTHVRFIIRGNTMLVEPATKKDVGYWGFGHHLC